VEIMANPELTNLRFFVSEYRKGRRGRVNGGKVCKKQKCNLARPQDKFNQRRRGRLLSRPPEQIQVSWAELGNSKMFFARRRFKGVKEEFPKHSLKKVSRISNKGGLQSKKQQKNGKEGGENVPDRAGTGKKRGLETSL